MKILTHMPYAVQVLQPQQLSQPRKNHTQKSIFNLISLLICLVVSIEQRK